MLSTALRFFALALSIFLRNALSSITCFGTEDCEARVGSGSECRDGSCSNPFAQGCLKQLLPGWHKQRVCNSDDPPEAAEQGYCRKSSLDYTEIRISSQNWESPVFESWILQIILSEMLDVPATIETGNPDGKLSLYDPNNEYEYGIANDYEALKTANDIGDCRLANRDPDNYQSCGYIIPEKWNWQFEPVQGLIREEVLEPVSALGVIGYESWFIPKFTAEKDPSLLSYLGLAGEKNRKKLAHLFLRPTTWKDYCNEVSLDNCQKDDGVAKRAPKDASENNRMFVDGLYTGHFRKTDKNNCTKHPTNCTGHFAGYPCSWPSHDWQRAYHLAIAVEGDGPELYSLGYPAPTLKEIWRAANATKSNVMMIWYSPEAVYQEFLGTDAEFIKVGLPTPTQECFEHRVPEEYQCSANFTERVGDPRGACDTFGNPIQKLIASGLFKILNDLSLPEAIRNPGYDVISRFRISEVQLGEMFKYWAEKSSPREAICQWVTENMYEMKTFIPYSYPRVLQVSEDIDLLFYCATTLGACATILVLATGGLVFMKRKERVMRFAQVSFLALLLAGLLCVSVGALIQGAVSPPTDASCVAVAWLVNFGYTMELVPLIVKVAAFNHLMNAAKRMKRKILKRKSLFGAVFIVSATILLWLLAWTILDPPRQRPEYELDDTLTEDGATIVTVRYFCGSESGFWFLSFLVWNTFMLICASVLAFQARKLRQEFNESQTLAIMIYSHFVFVVMRLITFLLSDVVSSYMLGELQSIISSIDTIATLGLYFLPKFLAKDHAEPNRGISETIQPEVSVYGGARSSVYSGARSSNYSGGKRESVVSVSVSSDFDQTQSRYLPSGSKKKDGDESEVSCKTYPHENHLAPKLFCQTCGETRVYLENKPLLNQKSDEELSWHSAAQSAEDPNESLA